MYKEYVGESGFTDEHNNPILNTMLGAGATSYGNIFASDGVLESYAEGAFVSAISDYASGVSAKESFISGLNLSKTDMVSLGSTLVINTLQDSEVLSSDISLHLNNLATATTGIINGGMGLVMAPAVIFYRSADYLATGLHQYSQGTHLVNYYYFSHNYSNLSNEYLNSNGQLQDWLDLKVDGVCTNNALNDDNIAQALCNHNYGGYIGSSAGTVDEIRTAYAIANLFLIVEAMDIKKLQQEIVARVKLEDLKDHGFFLKKSYASPNKYTIQIPTKLENDAEHGTPVAVEYRYDNINIFENYSDALSNISTISDTELAKKFTLDLGHFEATKISAKLSAKITYSDNFIYNSETELRFNPQITNLELRDIPDELNMSIMNMSVYMCGDIEDEAVLYYKNSTASASSWDNISFSLSDPIDMSNNCRKYTIAVDGYDIYRDTGFGNVNMRIQSADKISTISTKELPNPNDTDHDGLPDDWEMKYFPNLSQGKMGDPDEDGKNNYQEYLNRTDPTKKGALGITNSITFKTYQQVDGSTVSTFNPYGEIWANVVLESGTLDLEGKTLTIEGNLYQTGGTLKVNNGTLIVKGDYLIANGDSYSSGQLHMVNDSDYVKVYGDFVMDTHGYGIDSRWTNSSVPLSAGTLEIKGDFTQRNTGAYRRYSTDYYYIRNFAASGTHRVILSGDKKQTVNFASAGSSYSHFNILEITKTTSP